MPWPRIARLGEGIDSDVNTDATRVRIIQRLGQVSAVKIKAWKIPGVCGVAKAEVHRVRASIYGGPQRGRRPSGTNQFDLGVAHGSVRQDASSRRSGDRWPSAGFSPRHSRSLIPIQ